MHQPNVVDKGCKYRILIAINLTYFFLPVTTSAVNVALPTIGTEFSMDAVLLAWVTNSFLLASTGLLLPIGQN
jgi:MFS family permease